MRPKLSKWEQAPALHSGANPRSRAHFGVRRLDAALSPGELAATSERRSLPDFGVVSSRVTDGRTREVIRTPFLRAPITPPTITELVTIKNRYLSSLPNCESHRLKALSCVEIALSRFWHRRTTTGPRQRAFIDCGFL
jgi:hypothetical protein